MFGLTIGELVPYLYHDQGGPAAQQMKSLTQLFSNKDDRSQEQVEMLIGMSRGFRTVAKFLFPIPEKGLERRLWRIKAPTLIVWGEQDRFISPLYGPLFRDKIPNAELVTLPNTGHAISLESPEAFAEAVSRWGGQH
jgi:pimeloyl-ACP methyl ester carboxylesterase